MIVSSTVTEEGAQIDGRRWVCERHTDDAGAVQEFRYLAEPELDVAAVMVGRAAALTAAPPADEGA